MSGPQQTDTFHRSMAYSQVEVGGILLLIRKVEANIFNKQSQTADTGWTSNLGVGRKSKTPRRKFLLYEVVNLLKPTGYVMHYHQFNIQQLYALPTLYLCVLYLSENKQQLVPLTA